MNARVRRARPDDLPALLELFHELDRLQREWRLFTPRPGAADEVVGRYGDLLARPDALVAVAEDEGSVVGMALAELRAPSRFSDARALEVSGVIVREDRRREGIGRLLMHEVVRFSRQHGIDWVTLRTFAPNQDALAFWEDLGFSGRVVELVASLDAVAGRLGDA